jgi:hypothetical protein
MEVKVEVSFPISSEKARRVLEAWHADKERRRLQMRERRAGKRGKRPVEPVVKL